MGKRRIIKRRIHTRKLTLFGKPTYKKYADIVELDDSESARASVRKLWKEFRSAKTHDKKLRVYHVTDLAYKRAKVIATKKKRLSAKERREFREIARIYKRARDKMRREL